jgi:hypothetical protein
VNASVFTLNEQSYLLAGPLPVVSVGDGSPALAARRLPVKDVRVPQLSDKLSIITAALPHGTIARFWQVTLG